MVPTDAPPSDRTSDDVIRGRSDVDVESAAFVDVDLEGVDRNRFRPDGPTLALLAGLALVAVLFAYDYTQQPQELFRFLDWDVTRVDWLLLVSGVLFARYGLLPLALDRNQTSRVLRKLLRRPAAVVSLAYLSAFAVVGILGPEQFFPIEYARLKYNYQPPVYATFPVDEIYYYKCKGAVSNGMCHGSWRYPFGTTAYGGNLLKIVAIGMRIALKLGFAAGMIMALLATLVGTAAGYYGGWVDDVLMGYVDVQQTVPAIVVYIVVATVWLGELKGVTDGRMLALILVFGLLNWGGMAQLVRSGVLTRSSKGYVRAAKAAGASDLQVIRTHIIPNSKATIVTSLTRQIPLLILAQVALAYLKLNRIKSSSIGGVLRTAHAPRSNVAGLAWHEMWWMSVIPLAFLVVTVLAFNLLGDTLRDVLDVQEAI